jgi:transposase
MSTKFRLSDLVPAGFIAERITHIDDETCILLSSGATASCSACGQMSRTVRSCYCRQVADLPCQEGAVRLLVRTRRFTCDAVLGGRQIFAGRFGDVLPPYARRTGRLEHLVHHLALALGGRPAARFCSAAHPSRQQRHLAPRHTQARIAAVDSALGDWHRRLGLAAQSSLWQLRLMKWR